MGFGGTRRGGQFVVNGTPQTGGHEIDVTPGDVADTMFDVGTLGGTDHAVGAAPQQRPATGWQPFTVTAPAARLPTLTVHNDSSATRGITIALYHTCDDHRSRQRQLSEAGSVGFHRHAGGGQFVVNGNRRPAGTRSTWRRATSASTVFDVGTLGGTDTLWAQLLQWNGQLTGWQASP